MMAMASVMIADDFIIHSHTSAGKSLTVDQFENQLFQVCGKLLKLDVREFTGYDM